MRRFTSVSLEGEEAPPLAGTWEMRRNADEVSAPRDTRTWQVFLRQSGAELSGTILRVDGFDECRLDSHSRCPVRARKRNRELHRWSERRLACLANERGRAPSARPIFR